MSRRSRPVPSRPTRWSRPGPRRWSIAAAVVALSVVSVACGAGAPAVPRPGAVPPPPDTDLPAIGWQWDAPRPGNVGVPAVDERGIVVSYGHLRLVALDAEGDPQWEVERLGLRDVAPRLAGDLAVAATDDGVLAVERTSGRIVWDAVLGERANVPTVAAGLAHVTTWEGSLVALDLAGGTVAWRVRLPGLALGPAAVHEGTVLATWESEPGSEAGLSAFDAASGREHWRLGLRRGGVSAPAVAPAAAPAAGPGPPAGARPPAGTVVVVDGSVGVLGVDLASGTRRWTTVLRGAGAAEVPPVVLASGKVLVTHRLGGLALVDPADGRLAWEVVSEEGVVQRAGPAGPTPDGRFALPLEDGTLLMVKDGGVDDVLDPPGRVSGVAVAGPHLLVATRESGANALFALTGW